MQPAAIHKSFLFGPLSPRSSSNTSPKSPRFSISFGRTEVIPPTSPSPPLAETRPRSGSDSDHPKKRERGAKDRRGTLSTTVDHIAALWHSHGNKDEKKDKEERKDNQKEEKKEAERKHSGTRTRAATTPVMITGKGPGMINEKEGKKVQKEAEKRKAPSIDERKVHTEVDKNGYKEVHYKRNIKRYSRDANAVISTEVVGALKGLNEPKPKTKPIIPPLSFTSPRTACPPSPTSPRNIPARPTSPTSPRSLSSSSAPTPPTSPRENSPPSSPKSSADNLRFSSLFTRSEPHQKERERVRHKARSEGSLLAAIFSKKLERGGLMQKSSSLIALSPLENRDIGKSGTIQTGKKPGYFSVSLSEAMEMQKEKYPNLSVPVIMVKLTEAILQYGGKTEGILRVTGNTQQVCKMQEQFNEMNFEEISKDPHVLAGVLKNWFRELREPLIPNCIYRDCLDCETPTECLTIINKMPELNKAVFAHFVGFLRELSKPEYLTYTKMDVNSLCLVSAPMLFRCPSTDMADLIVNMQKEKAFLGLALESSFK
eukprot:Phypoly_transcript_05861.p1 GENE.Phypoly_transcript_05861~~Phypoly_transcript_05861.p1  ORF type:complete len:542 (+),score=112.68 Phypoly_transcript_05861:205-1830(+)